VTHKAAATAIAASAALPPFFSMSRPIDDANGCEEATHPLRQRTGDLRDMNAISSTPALSSVSAFWEAANQSPMILVG